MSNTRAPIQNIPLNGELNLGYNKAEIKPFTGFNKRNAPFLSETLSPVYAKEIQGGTGIYDNEGNFYSIVPGVGNQLTLTKNGSPLTSFAKGSVSKSKVTLHTGVPLCMGSSGSDFYVLESGLNEQLLNKYNYKGEYVSQISLGNMTNTVLAYDMEFSSSTLYLARLYIQDNSLHCRVDTVSLDLGSYTTTDSDLNWTTSSYDNPIVNLVEIEYQSYGSLLFLSVLDRSGVTLGKTAKIWWYNTADSGSFVPLIPTLGSTYPTDVPPTFLAKDGYVYQVSDYAGYFRNGYPYTSNFDVPLKAKPIQTNAAATNVVLGTLQLDPTTAESIAFSSGGSAPAHGWSTYPTPKPTFEVLKTYYRAVIGNKVSTTNVVLNTEPTNITPSYGLTVNSIKASGAGIYFVCTNKGLYYGNPSDTTYSVWPGTANKNIRYVIECISGYYAVSDNKAYRLTWNGSDTRAAVETTIPADLVSASSVYAPIDVINVGGYGSNNPLLFIVAFNPHKTGKVYWSNSYTGTWFSFDGGATNFKAAAPSNSSFDIDNIGTDYLFLAREGANVVRYAYDPATGFLFSTPTDCGIQLDYITSAYNRCRGQQVYGVNGTGVYYMGTAGGTTFNLAVSDTSGACGGGDPTIGSSLINPYPSTISSPVISTVDHLYCGVNRASPTVKGNGCVSRCTRSTTGSSHYEYYDESLSLLIAFDGTDNNRPDVRSLITDYGEDARIDYIQVYGSTTVDEWWRSSTSGLYAKSSPSDPTWVMQDNRHWVGVAWTAYVYRFAATNNAVYRTTLDTTSTTTSNQSVRMFEGLRSIHRNNIGTIELPAGSDYAGQIYTGMQVPLGEFKLLYNLSQIQGVSLSAPDSSVGALLTSWSSLVPGDALTPVHVINGTLDVCMVKVTTEPLAVELYTYDSVGTPNMQIVFNRYITIARAGANCYDTELLKMTKYASDYNNTMYLGVPIGAGISGSGVYQQGLIGSGQGALYEAESNMFPSAILNPMALRYLSLSSSFAPPDFSLSPEDDDIDIFYTANATEGTPVYWYSFAYDGYWYDTRLAGLSYPVDTTGNILNPIPLYYDVIADYTSQALVVLQETAYPIVYTDGNTKPVFLYSLLGGFSGVVNGFVISGTTYLMDDLYIYRANYINRVLDTIVNVAYRGGMQFIGNTTQVAYFYSSLDRTIYSFTGALHLEPVYECSEVEDVVAFGYNIATGEIGIATTTKVVIMSSKDIWALNIPGVDRITLTGSGLVLHTATRSLAIRYYKTEGYERLPLLLQTQFYGYGNNQVAKVDTLYIRLAVNDPDSLKGNVKVSATVLTDVATRTTQESKVFQIKETDWDKLTNTLYLRYQPKYQTSLATSFEIESDFAVESICVGASPMGVTQVTKNNI